MCSLFDNCSRVQVRLLQHMIRCQGQSDVRSSSRHMAQGHQFGVLLGV